MIFNHIIVKEKMFKLLFIMNLLFIDGFVKFKEIKSNKYKLNLFDYNEFDVGKKTYTIISNTNEEIFTLLDDVKEHKINYVFIDKSTFSMNELIDICNYYSVDKSVDILTSPLIFFEDQTYIGSTFELYEIMKYY